MGWTTADALAQPKSGEGAVSCRMIGAVDAACMTSVSNDGLLVWLARFVENVILSKTACFVLISSFLIGYVALILSAAHSADMQRGLMYLAWTGRLRGRPEKLQDLRYQGLSVNVRNVHCDTEDGIALHGYHMAPSRLTSAATDVHTTVAGKGAKRQAIDAFFDSHLASARVVVLYLHGIALDRAFHYRLSTMNNLANQFDAHVIAFDYRGFGDVEGKATETGTRCDARAMEAWLDAAIRRGREINCTTTRPVRILYGHSMGSSIATYLAGDKICGYFNGLIVNGPFVNADAAMRVSRLSYPIRILPWVFNYVASRFTLVSDGYKTDVFTERVPHSMHVLFLHGEKDATVPIHLGRELFNIWSKHRLAAAAGSATTRNAAKHCSIGSLEFVEILGGMHSDNFKFSAWTAGIGAFMKRVELSAAEWKQERPDKIVC